MGFGREGENEGVGTHRRREWGRMVGYREGGRKRGREGGRRRKKRTQEDVETRDKEEGENGEKVDGGRGRC